MFAMMANWQHAQDIKAKVENIFRIYFIVLKIEGSAAVMLERVRF